MVGKQKKRFILIFLLVLFIVWTFLILFVGPEVLITKIGVRNTYFIVFVLATVGGVSSITGASFLLTIVTFAGSGSNPFLLGLFGGIGIFIGDIWLYYIVHHSFKIIKEGQNQNLLFIANKIEKLSTKKVLVLVYLYLGFTPFPSDFLIIALSLSNISPSKLAPVILAGGLTLVTTIAYFGHVFLFL